MRRVLILGGNGMLGAALVSWFANQKTCAVSATSRSGTAPEKLRLGSADVRWLKLDADAARTETLAPLCANFDLVINAIGRIKQRISEQSLADREATLRANALFAIMLAQAAEATETRTVQIATDCVFSGERGQYSETARHDAYDLYGLSKSLGEVRSSHVTNLRCSIVGLELASSYSLLSWFLSQPRGAKISGYTNHFWNGVTALHFAKVCHGLLSSDGPNSFDTHLIPSNSVTKYELLTTFAEAFNRLDVKIVPTEAPQKIDRTLATTNPELNSALWRDAGYFCPPTIQDMIMEIACYVASNK